MSSDDDATQSNKAVDPRSPEFQARAWALFDAQTKARQQHEDQFGKVFPIVETEAWGRRLVGSGNAIYSLDPRAGFHDFLRDYLWDSLGEDWVRVEATKPSIARHPIAQWRFQIEKLIAAGQQDQQGRVLVTPDGWYAAYIYLAYDLHVVRQHVRFRDEILTRIRAADSFNGARYELFVAASFVRAGFSVHLEDEQGAKTKVPEFLAFCADPHFVIAVEAKARNRRASDVAPSAVQMDERIEDAALKALARPGVPFALFLDVAMPPGSLDTKPHWLHEVAGSVDSVSAKHRSARHPLFDWVFFTNIPHRYALDQPDPPRQYADYVPALTRIPEGLRENVVRAIQKYGAIPEFADL